MHATESVGEQIVETERQCLIPVTEYLVKVVDDRVLIQVYIAQVFNLCQLGNWPRVRRKFYERPAYGQHVWNRKESNYIMILFLPSYIILDSETELCRNEALAFQTSSCNSMQLPFFLLFKLFGYFVIASNRRHQTSQVLICQILEQGLDELWDVILKGNLAELIESESSAVKMLFWLIYANIHAQ